MVRDFATATCAWCWSFILAMPAEGAAHVWIFCSPDSELWRHFSESRDPRALMEDGPLRAEAVGLLTAAAHVQSEEGICACGRRYRVQGEPPNIVEVG